MIILSYAFRPFFLLSGIFAVLAMLAWLLTLLGHGMPPVSVSWHAHEMLVGFALAAVAGFSLTAVSVWTGRPALHGAVLACLVLCWLLGRLAMALAGALSPLVVLMLDMLFPVLLCILLGREVFAARNRRNYQVVGVLACLAAGNLAFHLGQAGVLAGAGRPALVLIIHAMLLLVAIIAGRITPSFTGNWLRLQGVQHMPRNTPAVDRPALSLTVVTGLSAVVMPAHPATGVLAFAAALAHAFRLSRWRGFATISNPLLFVLHAAYAWIPIGYATLGCAVFGWFFTPASATHALTMGAIGSMVLAVATRVALGHTGRPLQAAPATVVAYWIFMIAVVIRVFGAPLNMGQVSLIGLSSAGWILVFAIFTAVYWPILIHERADAH